MFICFLQPNDEQRIAIDKINNLLENFMGINDAELGEFNY